LDDLYTMARQYDAAKDTPLLALTDTDSGDPMIGAVSVVFRDRSATIKGFHLAMAPRTDGVATKASRRITGTADEIASRWTADERLAHPTPAMAPNHSLAPFTRPEQG
jgi:hypothetical protein